MLSPYFFVLWGSTPIAGGFATYRTARYPAPHSIPLLLSLAFSTFRLVVQFCLSRWGTNAEYIGFFNATRPLAALLGLAVAVGIFWSLAASFQRFRAIGSWLLVGLATIASLATWTASGIGGLPFGANPYWLSGSVLFYRHGMAVAGLTVLLSRLILTRSPEMLPVSRWAVRAADFFGAYALLGSAIAAFTMWAGTRYVYAVVSLPLANFLWFALACAIWLPRADRFVTARVMSEADLAAIDQPSAALRALRALARRQFK